LEKIKEKQSGSSQRSGVEEADEEDNAISTHFEGPGLVWHSLALQSRLLANSQYSDEMSNPTYLRFNASAATQVVPLPQKGSSTTSPSKA
jgi:hypothetical protein